LIVVLSISLGKVAFLFSDKTLPTLPMWTKWALEASTILLLSVAALNFYVHKKISQAEIGLTHKFFDNSNEAIVMTDIQGTIIDVNQAFTDVTGYSKEEAVGKNPRLMKSGQHDEHFYQKMWSDLTTQGRWEGEIWDKRKNGEVYLKWLKIAQAVDAWGKPIKYIGFFSDLTTAKEYNEHIEFLTYYDHLTRLPNRLLFFERLRQSFFVDSEEIVALMLININRFQSVNESLGTVGGDELLKEVAQRLASILREKDTVARIGGDEFAMIITNLKVKDEAVMYAKKINNLLSDIFILQKQHVYVSARVGVSLYPNDALKPEMLLKNAAKAIKFAKDAGLNCYQFFNPTMNPVTVERHRLETNLRFGIENDEFVLHYQPQIDLKTGLTVGSEALIRRQEPEWLVPPGMFMGIAEETGLIVPICEWTLKEACKQTKAWHKMGLTQLRISVNISAIQFKHHDIIKKVQEVLHHTGLDPNYLDLEITERVIMSEADKIIDVMRELKKIGVSLSIDDFGTGYSSLRYLNRFPVDVIKIDISFIRDIPYNPQTSTLVKTIIGLSHSLGFKALAEGVENKEQLDFLLKHKCDMMQGFYHGRPMPPDKFVTFVKKEKPVC
jgi:diguanylate cyclase (GGDEF)-like protein/PAS domain S-box-containing protein